MVAQTKHQTTKYAAENKWHGDLFTDREKPTQQKPHWVIFRSPLLKFHYYHNKRLQVKESQYFILTCGWTFTLIPNWTCYVVIISSFQYTVPSMWLTNCADPNTRLQSPTRYGCWLQSSSVYHTIKIKKLLGYKTLWCTNTTTSLRERWIRANSVSSHNLHEQNFTPYLCNLCHL